MAIMYPKDIELYDINPTEKKVYYLFKEQLPDTYTVFHSVQWVSNNNDKRDESECDFLIFSDTDGFLACEVKGGIGYSCENGDFILTDEYGPRKLRRSPMEQAEESSRYFKDLYSNEYHEQFDGIYGSISFFPRYSLPDDPALLDHRPKDIVFDINNNDRLEKSIRKAFAFYKSNLIGTRFMTKNQKDNFKALIHKMIAVKAVAGSIIEEKQRELDRINRVQDSIVYLLKNQNRTFLTGGAGTGKTWIAYKFAVQAALENKTVLITTFNDELNYIFKEQLKDYEKVDILSFDELMIKDGINPELESEDLLNAITKKAFTKYDTVIVDEAQDFDQFQALILSGHLKNDSSEFRVFYDLTQNIFDKDFRDGFDIKAEPYLLRDNLRNTESIYEWATTETNLGKDVVTNQIIGPAPIVKRFGNDYEIRKFTENEIIKLVDNENVKTSNIVILLDHDLFEQFNNNELGRWICKDKDKNQLAENEMKVSLVEKFKGLESDIVFYLHKETTPMNYNYVAYTRARYYLYNLILK